MKEIIIGAGEAGQRLDKYLRRYLPSAGSGFIYRMLRKKNITLNAVKAAGSELLSEGDRIALYFSAETLEKLMAAESGSGASVRISEKDRQAFSAGILYEDKDVLFLNKPAGLLSQSDDSGSLSACDLLTAYLADKGELTEDSARLYRPSAVNRLDRNTSGILICAKTYQAARVLSEEIKGRRLKKEYLTLVKGAVEAPALLTGWLVKDSRTNTVTLSKGRQEKASKVQTRITPLYRAADFGGTWIIAELISGKTHQIRAQLSAEGHPLAGDAKYGDRSWNGKLKITSQMLHAFRLTFPAEFPGLPALAGRIILCEPPSVFREKGYHGIL